MLIKTWRYHELVPRYEFSNLWKKCAGTTMYYTPHFLVHLAVDAYNDSQVKTVNATSWPSRSLSVEHNNHLLHLFKSEQLDTDFVPFNLPDSYYCTDLAIYAEMRAIIERQEMKKVARSLKESICYSVQIDGSTDNSKVCSTQ